MDPCAMNSYGKSNRDHSSGPNQYRQQSQQRNQYQNQSNPNFRPRRQQHSSTRNPNYQHGYQNADSSGQYITRDPNNNQDNPRTQIPTGGQRFIFGASTRELPPIETKVDASQRKFLGRCRLFVGNLPHNTSEEKVRELFERYGEVGEVFLGPKSSFAFIKMDTRHNAEAARDNVDSTVYDGRTLRVRLAAHAAAIRVKNISPQVTNELLAYAFRHFGEIERAVVVTDDKGKSTGEGIVEYAKKNAASYAIKRCQQESFLLTASPLPVLVEAYDQHDEEDGLPERSIAKHSPEFIREREVGPRFAEQGSFEYNFASRWKVLYEVERQKREKLEEELKEARQCMQNQIEYSRLEHDTVQLKNKLKQLEDDRMKLQQYKDPSIVNYERSNDRRQQDVPFRTNDDVYRRQSFADFNNVVEQDSSGMHDNSNKDLTSRQGAASTEQVSDSAALSNSNDSNVNSGLIIPSLVSNQPGSYAETTMVEMNQQYIQQPLPNQQMMAMPMYSNYQGAHMAQPAIGMVNYSTNPSAVSGYPQSTSQSSDSSNNYIQKQEFKPPYYQNNYNNNPNNASNMASRHRKRARF